MQIKLKQQLILLNKVNPKDNSLPTAFTLFIRTEINAHHESNYSQEDNPAQNYWLALY